MNFKQHTPYFFVSSTKQKPVENSEFEIYTDGAYFKQHHLGGWGVAIYQNDQLIKTLSGSQLSQSSLEMELIAAIKGLEWMQQNHRNQGIALFTDAQILLEGLFEKHPSWQAQNWHSGNGNPVAFAKFWQALYSLAQDTEVTFYWVKGHYQDSRNQLADRLARDTILQMHSI